MTQLFFVPTNYAIKKKTPKFFLLYEGSFKIVEVKQHNVYTLISPDDGILRCTHNVIHLENIFHPLVLTIPVSPS